jgi:hypothetical protein
MNALVFARKLRQAADLLEELFGHSSTSRTNETPVVAKKILKSLKTAKGKKFPPGTHWTQKPENKARLAANMKRMWRGKRKSA